MKWWERLQQRIDELGWSKAELSRRAEINYDSINKYLRGDIDNPRGNVLEKLAGTIDRSVLWLRDGIEQSEAELNRIGGRMVPVRTAGTVEAGAFREVDELDQGEPDEIYLPPDSKYPNARQMAFVVAGDSMNNLDPRPILPGDRAICVAYSDIASQVKLRDGMVVVVQRQRDGGHFREWSIKQIELYEDRTVFAPRSNNPKHKPIVVPRDHSADNGEEVEVIALLRRVVNDYDY
ncbi:XRE family transcriptional regulator [Brucella sp. NBRC 113783]|uniref:LexA family transcriptional regulator n=1 Tax=Brucella sp. NBRC 113783 TaxID=3075478 RepID=UPI0029BFB8BE|nr:XRE family transcriptional regulator [Brucella sp. NBRC 113783]MDX4072537.1 XRE family transcriptional regulator [Brucella sp. NBRC 113783]